MAVFKVLVKHAVVFSVLNCMIYGISSDHKSLFLKGIGAMAYMFAHIGLFEYYFSLKERAKKMETSVFEVKCHDNNIQDKGNGNEQDFEALKQEALEKVMTIQINHDLIVGMNEMKELLWDIKKTCLSKRNRVYYCCSQYSNSSSNLEEFENEVSKQIDESKGKAATDQYEVRKMKKTKFNSFNGSPTRDWE